MHRPFWLRAVIALWGLWFTTALSEPAAFHTCPMHGGAMAQHAMAGHASHSRPTGDHGRSSQQCTCLGACCCAAPVLAPSATFELSTFPVRTVAVAPLPPVRGEEIVRAYALPFAIGPPASLRASL